MGYNQENDTLVESFFKRTFHRNWKLPFKEGNPNFKCIEFFINATCNLSCKYCYIARYGDKLYPPEISSSEQILKNLDIVIDWIIENKYKQRVEFFSGEPMVQDVCLKVLETLIDRFSHVEIRPEIIVVPTNYSFLLEPEKEARVRKILEASRKTKVPICLSGSIDGKMCEVNRPFKIKGVDGRDGAFYDKAFSIAKEYRFKFHPMLYSENIEKWKDNWLWFQAMLEKYKLPFNSIYLLEVRNIEWSQKQITDFEEFLTFLIHWTFKHLGCNKARYINFLFDDGYNILRSMYSTVGRGLGCSIQGVFMLRLGDLAWAPCHRTSYPSKIYAHMKVVNNKIVGFRANNPEMLMAVYTMDAKNQPYCEQCLIRTMCSLGCLGSQLEEMGDMFIPIPTVCQMEHAKIEAVNKAHNEIGVLGHILERSSLEKIKVVEDLL